DAVHQACHQWHPDILLTTGISPVTGQFLERVGSLGVVRLNYLTDDPWNRAHYAPWFMKALRQYDLVFSLRRSNITDLKNAGCRAVEYLPFGYDPSLHFIEQDTDRSKYDSDVLFIGGADRTRIPYCHALTKAGLRLSLYGDYWNRYIE